MIILQMNAPMRSQGYKYYPDVQKIILSKCAPCHHTDGAAPFVLDNYDAVSKRALMINKVIQDGYMPPWFADTAFRHFNNEIVLTLAEKNILSEWIISGKKKGKAKRAIPFQLKSSARDSADLVFELNETYHIPGDNKEHYKIFIIPTHLSEPAYLNGIEFVPGNKKLAHHARIMIDTTGLLRADDGLEVGDDSEFMRKKVKLYDPFYHGWVPGNNGVFFPGGITKKLPANTDLVINIHYAASPIDQEDRSAVKFYSSKIPTERRVQTMILDENWVVNQPFEIPEDTLIKFYMRSPPVPYDLSLINVLPHMHLLGQSFKSYAISPDGDMIPLIMIDRWNFNWQYTYEFSKFIHIPKGSFIYTEAEYNNLSSNPINQNQPPKKITYGWGTKDEMLNVIFQYVPYRPLDEFQLIQFQK